MFGWRLLAANNRAVGRGVTAYASLSECMAAAAAVKQLLAVAPLRPDIPGSPMALDANRGKWTWRVTEGTETLAVSVHVYLRRAEAVRAINQFAEALRVAESGRGVVSYFGPRSLRAYDKPIPPVTTKRAAFGTAT